jgi:hypothetical protein
VSADKPQDLGVSQVRPERYLWLVEPADNPRSWDGSPAPARTRLCLRDGVPLLITVLFWDRFELSRRYAGLPGLPRIRLGRRQLPWPDAAAAAMFLAIGGLALHRLQRSELLPARLAAGVEPLGHWRGGRSGGRPKRDASSSPGDAIWLCWPPESGGRCTAPGGWIQNRRVPRTETPRPKIEPSRAGNVAHQRRPRNQSGYSSFRQVPGSAGWAFGVRSRRKVKYGATKGSGADTV